MNYSDLISAISEAHGHAQTGAAGAVNRQLIFRNWLIGAYIIEFEQKGPRPVWSQIAQAPRRRLKEP